ncbi:MAG TPA: DUF4838 domain-containing protein [Terriglobia bacterium]|nr:DUF4838 domain-containing protein [Terriglobia bacterium]
MSVRALLLLVIMGIAQVLSRITLAETTPRQPAISIVLGKAAPLPLRFAASELAKYAALMGNAKPGLVQAPQAGDICLGLLPPNLPAEVLREIESDLRGKDPDSFIIRSEGRRLIIYGCSARAVLYGTYHYLESLGVRWYFPGHENEIIPHAELKLSGYDIKQVPCFHKRGIVVFSTTPGFEDLVDFAAKLKLNTIGLHAPPYGPQTSDVGVDFASKVAAPRGLEVDVERHLFGEGFCPDDKSRLNLERKVLTNYVSQLPPSINDFFLWPADKFLAPCASARYRDYSVSDLVLWFANQMLATLRQSRPQARFAFLSYLSTWNPPTRERPSPGLILEWAPMFQSFAHPLDDPASTTNAEYRGDFEKLLSIFKPENSQVLGYWLDDTLFSRTRYGHLPYSPTALQGDLAYYFRKGVPAITTFGVITGRDYFASHASPAVFLYPRLLWDVDTDVRPLMRDFCRDYFGTDRALDVFDSLARADSMVYVEKHRTQTGRLNDPAFAAEVSKALRLAGDLLESQTAPQRRAWAARLVQEVASRFLISSPVTHTNPE